MPSFSRSHPFPVHPIKGLETFVAAATAMQTLRGGQQPPHIGQFLRGGTPEAAAGIDPVVGTQPGCAQWLDSLNVYLMFI